MKKLKSFKSEKDLRLFVKKILKESFKGLQDVVKIEIKVVELNPPKIQMNFPFYSEGNLLRALEVDFFVRELYNLGIEVEVYYLDDVERSLQNDISCFGSQSIRSRIS